MEDEIQFCIFFLALRSLLVCFAEDFVFVLKILFILLSHNAMDFVLKHGETDW